MQSAVWAGWSIVWGEKFSEVNILINPDIDQDVSFMMEGRPTLLEIIDHVRDNYGLELTTETEYNEGMESDFEVFAHCPKVAAMMADNAYHNLY